MQNIEQLLSTGGEFSPLRVATRKFYEKAFGNYRLIGIGKCIEKYRSPYVAINRPLLPIGIGSLNLKYPNYWLSVGVAEKFCSDEKKRRYLLAKDLPPLILKYQPTRRLNAVFLNALNVETAEDIKRGRLYRLTVGLGLKTSLQKIDADLSDMLNMKKLIKFIKALEDKAMEIPGTEALVISQPEFDEVYRDIYGEEIQRWQELKQEQQQKEKSEEFNQSEKVEEKQDDKPSYSNIINKYKQLDIDEDIANENTEVSYTEFKEQDDDVSGVDF